MNRFQKKLLVFIGALMTFMVVQPIQAAFHLWKIDEVYSNASGTVQFVELDASTNGGQQFVSGKTLNSNGHMFTFPANLPSDTTNKKFILATPGYIALTGVPTADYNLGVNNFFSISADTINFANVNTLTFTTGQLPTNGFNSLNRAYSAGATTFTTGANSPIDFTGNTGSVPVPPGDMNLDAHVNANDIKAMLNALTNPSGYAITAGITASQLVTIGDVNKDGKFNNADLQALLNKLKTGGGTTSTVPEPSSYILAALVGGLLWKSRRQFKVVR